MHDLMAGRVTSLMASSGYRSLYLKIIAFTEKR